MVAAKSIASAMDVIVSKQKAAGKPLAIVLAGHNGSGKSTFWYEKGIADSLQIPLINADRMMLSILPDPNKYGHLPEWAQKLRDTDHAWMKVAQRGVFEFVETAKAQRVLFALETVFSHWKENPDGTIESKIDVIKGLQRAGYFVLLLFVGLASVALSIGRVATRKKEGGHDVPYRSLVARFPRTQKAIRAAIPVADAALLVDNSRTKARAFTLCAARIRQKKLFDIREEPKAVPAEILEWLKVVAPIGRLQA